MQALIAERLGQFVAACGDHAKAAPGQAVAKDCGKARGQVIVEIINHTEVQRLQMGEIHHRDFALRLAQFAERLFGPAQKHLPGLGQSHGAAGVIDQFRPDGGFEVAHLLADGGLAEPRGLCCLRHRSAARERLKHFDAPKGDAFVQHVVPTLSDLVKPRAAQVKHLPMEVAAYLSHLEKRREALWAHGSPP